MPIPASFTKRNDTSSPFAPEGTPADGFSAIPAVSAAGHHLAFASGATNLIAADTNSRTDIFVRSLQP